MKLRFSSGLVAASLLAVAVPVFACEGTRGAEIDAAMAAAMHASGGVTIEMREAQSTAYEAWDAELNRIWRELMSEVPEADRSSLRTAQRSWLAFHEAEGQWLWTATMHGEEGTSAALTTADAGLARLRSRTCELAAQLAHIRERNSEHADGAETAD